MTQIWTCFFFCSSFDQYGFSETYAAIDHAVENPLRVKAKKLDQQAQKLDVSQSFVIV